VHRVNGRLFRVYQQILVTILHFLGKVFNKRLKIGYVLMIALLKNLMILVKLRNN
jgi:hypothetical protein